MSTTLTPITTIMSAEETVLRYQLLVARGNLLDASRPHTLRVSADAARAIIPDIVAAGEFCEASWVTGTHRADPIYDCGRYVTVESSGDYTEHPLYSGTHKQQRPVDMTVSDWVVKCLPIFGSVAIRVTTNRA